MAMSAWSRVARARPGRQPGWRAARCLRPPCCPPAPAQLPRASTTSTAASSHALIGWIREQGGFVHEHVEVVSSAAVGLGLQCTQDCRESDVLVSLPSSCILTYDLSNTDAPLKGLISRIPPSFWGLRLGLRVLQERAAGDASPLHTYICNLPASVPGLPMFFSGDAIRQMAYPPLIQEVVRRARFMSKFVEEDLVRLRGTGEDPFHGAEVDLNGLGWALAVTTSRAFAPNGPNEARALLPLIDMCNHSFRANCDIRHGRGGALELVAAADTPPGQPLLLNYGELDNHTLLLDYGFMVEENPHEKMVVQVTVDVLQGVLEHAGIKSTDLKPWQKQELVQLRLLGNGAAPIMTLSHAPQVQQPAPLGVDARLLAAAHAMCAPDSKATKPKDPRFRQVHAAALLLLRGVLLLQRAGLGIDRAIEEGKLTMNQAPDMLLAAQLRLSKAKLMDHVLASVCTQAEDACAEVGFRAADKTSLRDIHRKLQASVPRGFGG